MARGTRFAQQLYRVLLDLVLPPRCVVCGRVETWLCRTCAQKLPLADRPVCPRCGDAWEGPGVCDRCRTTPLHLASISSAFVYEDAVRDAIHALKYRGGQGVARPLAERMAEAWQVHHLAADLLVPVPLHIDREAQRGYNQSQLLARELAIQIGLPLAELLLYRVRATASQTRLSPRERWSNVKDAFACATATDLTGLRITLVDDVATTGATLDACAVALLARGARTVNAFTLAHAV